jgi:hypothetical protein
MDYVTMVVHPWRLARPRPQLEAEDTVEVLIVPADFVMSRDMLPGVKQRAESLASAGARR